LRVGLAAIKGLVEVLKKPIAAVSVLEALAIASGVSGRVFVALDAQRGEVFFGEYEVLQETLQATSLRQESLMAREALLTALPLGANVVTPDASIAALLPPSARQIERPGAEWIAGIGLRKILAGQTLSAEDLDANYVRRSDAEIFSKPGS
jgi:tRNA threonylcarbamoyladenosine biosynthesis protein TsaB